MNKVSLSYDNIEKQEDSLWIDEYRAKVNGATNMENEYNLQRYAVELVCRYAVLDSDHLVLTLQNLPEEDQAELARLYIETTDREISECVYGDDFSINSDYACAVMSILRENSKENRENLSNVIIANTIKYFSETLQDILDAACESYFAQEQEEAGFYPQRNMDNDEISWSKY